jgi:2-polyprenyl-3-methyl-5-hydroxy-6-metoxy-1,4-benzoquinol methylase
MIINNFTEVLLKPLDTRIPVWDQKKLEFRVCPICQSDQISYRYKRPDKLLVNKCYICSTHYVSPSPTFDALNEFYSTYHANHYGLIGETPKDRFAEISYENPYDDIRIATLSSSLNLQGARVLDVGCGKGEFLFKLKKLGANVEGIELDSSAVGFANKLGIKDIHTYDIELFEGNEIFDVVILNDFIEHPLDPMSIIHKSFSLLKKHGLLLIWTPNGDHLEIDPDKITLRVDLEHMQYLGVDSIKYITNKYLFNIIHYETIGFRDFLGINNLVKINKSSYILFIRRLIKRFPFFNKINSIRRKLLYKKNQRLGNYNLFCILKKM